MWFGGFFLFQRTAEDNNTSCEECGIGSDPYRRVSCTRPQSSSVCGLPSVHWNTKSARPLPSHVHLRPNMSEHLETVKKKSVVFTRRRPFTADVCVTYPQRVVIVEGVEQLDDVAMVTFGQDVNLHHVVLQLIFTLGLDLLGGGQSSSLLVPGLRQRKGENIKIKFTSFLTGLKSFHKKLWGKISRLHIKTVACFPSECKGNLLKNFAKQGKKNLSQVGFPPSGWGR